MSISAGLRVVARGVGRVHAELSAAISATICAATMGRGNVRVANLIMQMHHCMKFAQTPA